MLKFEVIKRFQEVVPDIVRKKDINTYNIVISVDNFYKLCSVVNKYDLHQAFFGNIEYEKNNKNKYESSVSLAKQFKQRKNNTPQKLSSDVVNGLKEIQKFFETLIPTIPNNVRSSLLFKNNKNNTKFEQLKLHFVFPESKNNYTAAILVPYTRYAKLARYEKNINEFIKENWNIFIKKNNSSTNMLDKGLLDPYSIILIGADCNDFLTKIATLPDIQ